MSFLVFSFFEYFQFLFRATFLKRWNTLYNKYREYQVSLYIEG